MAFENTKYSEKRRMIREYRRERKFVDS